MNMEHVGNQLVKSRKKIWVFWAVATSSGGLLSRKLLVLLILSHPVKWTFKAHMSGGASFSDLRGRSSNHKSAD